MSSTPLTVGMIGAGFISNYHIKGLQEAGARVGAVASDTRESAQQRAQEYGIPHYTGDYRDILADPDIDAVVIATPDYLHLPHAIDALRAGKATLLQKPMARNARECERILEVARETGTPLYVSFMHRYLEEVEHLRELLAAGALGEVTLVRQRNATPGANWADWFYKKENVGGGVLLQLGVHGIDLLRYLFGEIVSVRATTARTIPERTLADGTVVQPDAEDLVIATYRFESGMFALHDCCYGEVAGTDRFRMEVYGTKGTALLRTDRGRLALYAPDYLGREGWFTPNINTERIGYRQHRHWLAMLNGIEPPDKSAQDGLASILVAEAAYHAAATAGWEMVMTT